MEATEPHLEELRTYNGHTISLIRNLFWHLKITGFLYKDFLVDSLPYFAFSSMRLKFFVSSSCWMSLEQNIIINFQVIYLVITKRIINLYILQNTMVVGGGGNGCWEKKGKLRGWGKKIKKKGKGKKGLKTA